MTRDEFKKAAKETGYSDAEIKDLLALHDEFGEEYDNIPLLVHVED